MLLAIMVIFCAQKLTPENCATFFTAVVHHFQNETLSIYLAVSSTWIFANVAIPVEYHLARSSIAKWLHAILAFFLK